MKINLKNLSVRTVSGVELGNIRDIILDTESQIVLQYEVSSLFGNKYLISREQVISVDNEKMIVEDDLTGVENKNIKESKVSIEPEGVAMDQSV